MFWMRNVENNFPICSLIWRPVRTKNKADPDQLASEEGRCFWSTLFPNRGYTRSEGEEIKWAVTQENLSVFRVSDKVKLKPACSDTETS